MNKVAIVQARMGSTRLPGKVLKKIKDRFVLDYVIDRLRMCKKIDHIVLATTINKKDDKLQQYAINKKLEYYRGSEEDVLARYFNAAKKHQADIIIRVTSDCPLIDPEIVDKVIQIHIEKKADYTANTIIRSYPRGLDVEVFNFKTLESCFKNAKKIYQREHVTPYVRANPDKFNIENLEANFYLKRPDIRITLDTKEDLKLISKIINFFNDINFKTNDVIDFLDQNPELLKINKNIKQKDIRE